MTTKAVFVGDVDNGYLAEGATIYIAGVGTVPVPPSVNGDDRSAVRFAVALACAGYRLADRNTEVESGVEFEVERVASLDLLAKPDVWDAVVTLWAAGVTLERYAELLAATEIVR